MNIFWPQVFCIDSVIVTVCWANVHDVFLLPTHLQLYGPHVTVCWSQDQISSMLISLYHLRMNRKKICLDLPSDNTFRKLDFILCSTLMRLVISIITFLWNCWQLHNSPVACIQQNSAIAVLDVCEHTTEHSLQCKVLLAYSCTQACSCV